MRPAHERAGIGARNDVRDCRLHVLEGLPVTACRQRVAVPAILVAMIQVPIAPLYPFDQCRQVPRLAKAVVAVASAESPERGMPRRAVAPARAPGLDEISQPLITWGHGLLQFSPTRLQKMI